MKGRGTKVLGEERRELILRWLKGSHSPLTGSKLAQETNVSRQVIVQDISLLKARNEPIMATAQGYMYFHQVQTDQKVSKIIACQHAPEQTEDELLTIVDFGVTIKDVTIEHPVYGDLTGSIMIQNRHDVETFLNRVKETKASYLLELTDGVHLHTLEANDESQLQQACKALEQKGFLLRRS
ncbi:transcription repressor NadR [Pseudalkalibacillus berkeleyi]|uniref:Transcription repressor NadR n=1 Tax=Pseudalkalibacillus berkeleyi TaxID=1069813 RepID=A0ABS9H2Q5_9BACL|nr:transcription repressor NadR [Pseudalkalibacillus berkeleyi]MCF6138083.1 transcription repressor NadR [Pseudalkalibacillus berkeleyi]